MRNDAIFGHTTAKRRGNGRSGRRAERMLNTVPALVSVLILATAVIIALPTTVYAAPNAPEVSLSEYATSPTRAGAPSTPAR